MWRLRLLYLAIALILILSAPLMALHPAEAPGMPTIQTHTLTAYVGPSLPTVTARR